MVNVDNRGTGGPRGSNNSLYFIVGALVIAVLIIGWFMYGGDADVADETTVIEDTAAPAGDTNVTVEPTTPPPAAGDTNVTVEPAAPAAAPAAPEPAEPAAPPAGGAAPAPQ